MEQGDRSISSERAQKRGKKCKQLHSVDIEDVVSTNFKKKKIITSLKEVCDKLRVIDLKEVTANTNCSEDDVVAWLVSKFGFHNVNKAFQIYCQLPDIIVDSQKDSILSNESSIVQEIINVAEEMCPSILTEQLSCYTKQQEILVPPVTECIDCGGHLTNNHSSSVKVYTLSSQVGATVAQKLSLRCRKCGLF